MPNRYGTSREGRKSLYLCPPLVPMDLADAWLISMAESHNLQTVFTIDRKDFSSTASSRDTIILLSRSSERPPIRPEAKPALLNAEYPEAVSL